MNVIIIGGGVIGTVLTHLFSLRGVNVTLINSGLQKPRFPLIHSKLLRFPEDIRLARISEDVYMELSRELRVDVLRPMESITIIPEACYNDALHIMSMWYEVGAKVRVISDVHEYGLKRVNDQEIYIFSTNGDNFVNYLSLMNRVHKIDGVNYINGTATIKFSDHDVRVLINDNELKGDYVILASGAWNSIMIRNAGLNVPLLPYKCQAAAFISRGISTIVYDYVLNIYVRPLGLRIDNALNKLGLSIIVGGDGNSKVTEPGRDRGVDREFLNEVRGKVRARLGRVLLIGSRFGYCEITPDMRPVVGTVGSENLLLIGGFNGYGAEVGPALALAVVNYVISGSWPDYARPYLIDRFGNNWPSTWDIGVEAHELCV
ncbi:NAD(P)/FAD-dependent oxidoreductase [Vulcanisaeta distributa]|uniref:FAD dependent oxidoreductase n=1 Tax=Vulcanisaeta distributa (strain DSM 14429 / JCM 11212 / NBRC 100878 / IC-017) TaxID=572478 RepID=E1QUS5_VULDI|nr:FAD-binding oxidoreductase [Vulcanisaeta distributa]ADN49928.1 FAD dependent oxidoreductase [Vulcanisaeta distributa DSM 14429]